MVAERGRPRLAQHIVDVLVPLIAEEIVKVVKTVLQEQISEKICQQIDDVFVSHVVEQVTGLPKTPSRDRTLQCAAEQIPNVPVPEMVEQLVEVPETISQDRIKQRTVEQIVDAPVPQAVEELPMEVSKDRVQRRFAEQTIENPAISSAVKIIEAPVIRTPEKTRQLVNTHVQHVVDTVEVEKPEITELTVQRKEPIIQEKMNQVTKPIEFPQAQFLNKAGDMLVGMQRHVLMAQTVQKAMEVPPLQFTDKVVDNPVVAQRQIPLDQTVQKTMEIPHLQCVDEVIDVPAEVAVQAPHVHIVGKTVEEPQSQIVENAETPEIQMVRGTETSESLSIAPVCRSTQAEIVEAVEIGAIPPTEFARPIFVTTPVLETPRVQLIDKVVSIPVMAQRQVPSAQKVQKIVEMPKILCCSNRSVPLIMEQIVEAPQIIPREFVLSPCEGGTDGNHRLAPQKRKSISECGMTEDEPSENDVRRASASSCEVSCETHGLVQGGRVGSKWTRLEKGTRQTKGKVSVCSRWRQTWRPVAHTSRPRQRRSKSLTGPRTCARSAEWSSSLCAVKGSST